MLKRNVFCNNFCCVWQSPYCDKTEKKTKMESNEAPEDESGLSTTSNVSTRAVFCASRVRKSN